MSARVPQEIKGREEDKTVFSTHRELYTCDHPV